MLEIMAGSVGLRSENSPLLAPLNPTELSMNGVLTSICTLESVNGAIVASLVPNATDVGLTV